MNTKKHLIIAGVVAAILVGAISLVVAATVMPMVLQVEPNGGVLLRGTVDTIGTGSLIVKSWGGSWVINISSSTTLFPRNNLSQFEAGDFVGVRGVVNQNASWTVDATLVRNWTTRKIASKNQLTITFLQPTSGVIGTSVTMVGSGFTQTGNKVKFGNLGSENNPSYNLNSLDGTTIIFTVPSSNYFVCWNSTPACMAPTYLTQPGVYGVSVTNSNGKSNEVSFTVTSTVTCTPNWDCGWGSCTNGSQSMRIVDTNNCGTDNNPPTDRVCPALARVCY